MAGEITIPQSEQIAAGVQERLADVVGQGPEGEEFYRLWDRFGDIDISGEQLSDEVKDRIEEVKTDKKLRATARRLGRLLGSQPAPGLQDQIHDLADKLKDDYVPMAVAGIEMDIADELEEEPEVQVDPEQEYIDTVRRRLNGLGRAHQRYQEEGAIPPQELFKVRQILLEIESEIPGRVTNLRRHPALFRSVRNVSGLFDSLAVRRIGERSMSRQETFESLREAVELDTGIDISHASGFLRWFRDIELRLLEKYKNDAINLEDRMNFPIGVFQMNIGNALQLLPNDPKEFRGLDKISQFMGEQIDIEKFRVLLEQEMKFLSVGAIRRLQILRVYGDLAKQVEAMQGFAEGGSLMQLDADAWEQVGRFLPFYSFEKENGKYKSRQEEMVLDKPIGWAESFKTAMARYMIMRRVWQDTVPLKFKIVESGRRRSLVVLSGGFDAKKIEHGRVFDYMASLQNPAFGLQEDEVFNGNTAAVASFLEQMGFIPNGIELGDVSFVDYDTFQETVGEEDQWLVPGFEGRRELYRFETDDKYSGFRDKIQLARDGKWLDGNLFWTNPALSQDLQERIRNRIRLWAGGVNPDVSSPGSDTYRQAMEVGSLVEQAAYNLMFSTGVAQYLDMDQGDQGLNLVLQTRRYMNVQSRSGRAAAGSELMRHLNRIAPTFFETILVGKPEPFVGHPKVEGDAVNLPPSFEEWLLRTNYSWRDINIRLQPGAPNPDRVWSNMLFFGSEAFSYARGDKVFDFGNLAKPLPGITGEVQINEEIAAQMQLLWKMIYLWTAIPQAQNHLHHMYQEKGKYPVLSPIETARRVFKQILIQNLARHNPKGLFRSLTGVFAQREATPMKPDDDQAFRAICNEVLVMVHYDWLGNEVGRGKRLFSQNEVENMLNMAGSGEVATVRRLFGST